MAAMDKWGPALSKLEPPISSFSDKPELPPIPAFSETKVTQPKRRGKPLESETV